MLKQPYDDASNLPPSSCFKDFHRVMSEYHPRHSSSYWQSVLNLSSWNKSGRKLLSTVTQVSIYKNRSSADAISSALNLAFTHLESRSTYERLVLLDFSTAFNTIIPQTLMHELVTLGLSPSLYSWVADFFNHQHTDYQEPRLCFLPRGSQHQLPTGMCPLCFTLSLLSYTPEQIYHQVCIWHSRGGTYLPRVSTQARAGSAEWPSARDNLSGILRGNSGENVNPYILL